MYHTKTGNTDMKWIRRNIFLDKHRIIDFHALGTRDRERARPTNHPVIIFDSPSMACHNLLISSPPDAILAVTETISK